jgi:hypothetical protein
MAKDNTCKNVIIVLICILLFMLVMYACKDTESFANAVAWAKGIGYPRPQGNLSNYKYGTKSKARKEEQKSWNSVMKKGKERFKVPISKTVLV